MERGEGLRELKRGKECEADLWLFPVAGLYCTVLPALAALVLAVALLQ